MKKIVCMMLTALLLLTIYPAGAFAGEDALPIAQTDEEQSSVTIQERDVSAPEATPEPSAQPEQTPAQNTGSEPSVTPEQTTEVEPTQTPLPTQEAPGENTQSAAPASSTILEQAPASTTEPQNEQAEAVNSADFEYRDYDGGIEIVKYKGLGPVVNLSEALIDGKSVYSIAENAFSGENSALITSIILPDTLTRIGGKAFAGTNITSIIIPAGVTSSEGETLTGGWFYDCNALKTIEFAPGINSIPAYALANTPVGKEYDATSVSNSKTVIIPSSVRNIGDGAFKGCMWIKNLDFLPNSIITIGKEAFMGCLNLADVNLPSSVTNMNKWAFAGIDALKSVTLSGKIGAPEGVEARWFEGCDNLSEITISDGGYLIPDYAFAGLPALNKITVPITVEAIGNGALNESQNAVVYCSAGSVAHRFAEANGIKVMLTGNGSNPIEAPTQAAQSNLTAELNDDKVTLNWGEVPSANGYELQRLNLKTHKFVSWQDITAKDAAGRVTTTYVDDVVRGMAYLYRVRAYNTVNGEKQDVAFTNIASVAPAVARFGGKSVNGAFALSWNAMNGATKYDIYKAASQNGPYTKIDQTAFTEFKDTDVSSGSFYKVYPVIEFDGEQYAGELSYIVASNYAVFGYNATATSCTRIQVVWDTLPDATGYEITLPDFNNHRVIIQGSSICSAMYWANSVFLPNTKYRFYIRAFKGTGADTVFGPYSDTFYATTNFNNASTLKVANANGAAALSWTSTPYANGYDIEIYDTSKRTYKFLANSTSLKYTHSGLTAGQSYLYRIRPYILIDNKKIYATNYSNVVTASPLLARTSALKAVNGGYDRVTLTWQKTMGAAGYEIWRSTNNKNYSRVTVIKNPAATCYTNTGLALGTTYYYKIRAINAKNVVSTYSNMAYARTAGLAPSKLTAASSNYNTITLRWTPGGGCSGIEVWSSTNGKSYSPITTLKGTSTSYSVSKLTTGTRYYYKLRAYRTIGKSKSYTTWSSVVSAVPVPTAPASIKVASGGLDRNTISWSAVSGASGYEIYRSGAGKGNARLTTITNGKTVLYKNTGLTAGTAYTYTVRAYRLKGKTKIYGPFTKAASATPTLLPVSKITTSTLSGNVRLEFTPVSGASGYKIVCTHPVYGRFEYDAKGRTCQSIGGFKQGTKQTFSVRPYATINGKYLEGPAITVTVLVK